MRLHQRTVLGEYLRLTASLLVLQGPTQSLSITVRVIHTDAGKADVAIKYFGHQLTDGVKEGLPAFTGEPRPLDNPISTSQISYAASKLKSNRASGPTCRMSRSRTLITVSTK